MHTFSSLKKAYRCNKIMFVLNLTNYYESRISRLLSGVNERFMSGWVSGLVKLFDS